MREEDTVCVGSDGLQYCKVCGEAKEAFFPEGGFMGMKKHSKQCACDRKAYEEEQKYFKEKEHRELVSRNTSICFPLFIPRERRSGKKYSFSTCRAAAPSSCMALPLRQGRLLARCALSTRRISTTPLSFWISLA